VSRLEQIKDEVKRLSQADQDALLDWLTNVLEDELELTEISKRRLSAARQTLPRGVFEFGNPIEQCNGLTF